MMRSAGHDHTCNRGTRRAAGTRRGRIGRTTTAHGCADLRVDGTADRRLCWWRAGPALLERAWCVTAERNGEHVLADEHLSCSAMAEADLPLAKRRGRRGTMMQPGRSTASIRLGNKESLTVQ